MFFIVRGSRWLPRKAAAAPSTGPLQCAGTPRGQRERPAPALLWLDAYADHRCGEITIVLIFRLHEKKIRLY